MEVATQRLWIGPVLIGGLCVAFLGLAGRLVHFQLTQRPEIMARCHERQRSVIPLPGRRGTIYDRRQRVLAGSHDLPTVYADPAEIENFEQAALRLSIVLGLEKAEVLEKLQNPTSRNYVVIRRQADSEAAKAVRDLKLPGVGVRDEPARSYPMGSLAAHVIGFVRSDGVGTAGIEQRWENALEPTAGQRVVYRDVRRRPMFQEAGSFVPPRDGQDIVLTIDAAIQEVVEREVARQVTHFEAECGLGLVMDPRTGEVLALANVPTFEPARARFATEDQLRNRVLYDPMEPGSVFKPYVMAAALSEGLTRPDETIFCHNGLYVIGKRYLHDHHPYGNLTTAEGLAKSSNILMAVLGQRLGNARMHAALTAFGFGGRTGIDLPGEDVGLLMPLKDWTSYTTTSVPMGHELAVTPIQLAAAFSSLVNGGRLYQPRVVRAVLDHDGRIVKDLRAPIDRGRAIDQATSVVMQELLTKVVNEGTGRACQLEQWQVMGKTGTAQVPREGRRGYEPGGYLASFIAAAPASDPAVVVLVMIRKPNARIGYYGSLVALPAVKVILEETLTYLHIPPDRRSETGDVRLVWHE
jgi:cell division protein FtsI/penicillin-binding protein 2